MHNHRPSRSRREFRRLRIQADPHCFFCGYALDLQTSSVDHVEPTSRGGTDDKENLVLACRRCNVTKADRPLAGLAVCRIRGFGVLTERRMEAIRAQHGERCEDVANR